MRDVNTDMIREDLNRTRYNAFLTDETQCVARSSQFIVMFRYLTADFTAREAFWSISPAKGGTALEVVARVEEQVKGVGSAVFGRTMALSTDGCAVMMGKENGVQTRQRAQKCPRAFSIWCDAHQFNLCLLDGHKQCPNVQSAIQITDDTYSYFYTRKGT